MGTPMIIFKQIISLQVCCMNWSILINSKNRIQNIIQQQMNSSKPYVSRYLRKENYQSLNYPSPQPFSPHHAQSHFTQQQDHSAQKRSLQQKQIEDLEQKVDIILEHNEKLAAENADLKQRLKDTEMMELTNIKKERMSRYQVEDGQYAIRKIKSQLQIKVRQCQMLTFQSQSLRQANKKEADALKFIISDLTASNDQVKLQNIKLMQQIMKVKEEVESDKKLALKDQQLKMQQDIFKMEKEKIEEINREKQYHSKVIEELTCKFEEERTEWNNRKSILVNKLQETHNREINELRDQMASQFNHQLRKLEEQATERIQNQREKAQKFIKDNMDSIQAGNQSQSESLKQQIKALQISLDSRKHLLNQLTNNELDRQHTQDNFEETILIRQRLKEQVQDLLRQNQMLKIKTAEKYERDLQEMVKIYNDKIDILSAQIKYLSEQNDRLRANYELEIENKIKQRRNWEIEAGSLKNLIRKLKVELRGIQQQFKLNIEGIRDQNNTFSMTLMKSMIQDRDKANFFEDQNRKLRVLYQKHQNQVQIEKKQALERINFYQNKYEHLRRSIEGQKQALRDKEQMLQERFKERQLKIKEHIELEREHLQQMMSDFQAQRDGLERQVLQANKKIEALEMDLKQAKQDIEILTSKIKENQQHIERLRMQLQMAGVDDHQKQDAINHWREHYQGIILKLEGDKKELKQIIDENNSKIEKLVFKYKALQNQLEKANIALSRRGELDKKVIELGLDQSLVKNMSEIWKNYKQ